MYKSTKGGDGVVRVGSAIRSFCQLELSHAMLVTLRQIFVSVIREVPSTRDALGS
jgi:hypothetical protein